jgi:hypothetical protein
MAKLQNIKAVNELMAGKHRTQTRKTFGFNSAEKAAERAKVRTVGEVWAETDFEGKVLHWWKQHDGYRVKYNVHPDMSDVFQKIREEGRTFNQCPKDKCTCVEPTRLDKKFRAMMGLCHDCLVTMETRLKIRGEFDAYAREKMRANAEAFFREADKEVETIKETLSAGISYFNGDGSEEKWTVDGQRAMLDRIDREYNEFKENTLKQFSDHKGTTPE